MGIIDSNGLQSLKAGSAVRNLAGATRTYLSGFASPESLVRELLEKAGIEIGGGASDYIRRNWSLMLGVAKPRLLNLLIPSTSLRVGDQHYDLRYHLYQSLTDKT